MVRFKHRADDGDARWQMAVIDQHMTRELVQGFAARIQDVPSVSRLWYWAKPDGVFPGHLYIVFYVYFDVDDAELEDRITDILIEYQEQHENEIDTTLITLTPTELAGHDPMEATPLDVVEVPLHKRTC
jgi:hypothetical protein